MKRSSSRKTTTKRIAALATISLMVLALMAMGAPVSQAKGYLSPPAMPSEPPDPTEPPVLECFPLLITVSPSGAGTVDRSPTKSPGCLVNGLYVEGAQVQLTAIPSASYAFSGWSGDAQGSSNSTTVIIDVNPEVTATFTRCYGLYVYVSPSGSGSVSVTPPNCPGGKYLAGTVVTLTATPNFGFVWGYWTGGYSTFYNPVNLTMSWDRSQTANFVAQNLVYVPFVVK